jgi:pyroglutamyl-peptidase
MMEYSSKKPYKRHDNSQPRKKGIIPFRSFFPLFSMICERFITSPAVLQWTITMGEKGKILLTGFEPFGGSTVNPSISACKKLLGKQIGGFEIVVEEIPLIFKEIRGSVEGHIERHKPTAVICTGQSGRGSISLERVAINVANARIPYNCGKQPVDESLSEEGPAAYFSALPLRDILGALKEAGVPSAISNSAGTFGCNQIFYHLMDYRAREGLDIPAGFIHVPSLPEQVVHKETPSMALDLIIKALEVATSTVASKLL